MTQLASDAFTRADANPLDGSWTDDGAASAFRLVSNAVRAVTLGSDAAAHYNGVTWPNDQWSQCTTAVSGGTVRKPGPAVREATSNNGYRLVANHAASNNVFLYKYVGGTQTAIWNRTQAWTDGDTLYLQVIGTTLIATITGTAVGASATDSALASGSAGIGYVGASGVTTSTLDDWVGGDFVTLASMAGGLTPTATVGRQAQKALSGACSPTAVLAKMVAVLRSGGLTPSAALVKQAPLVWGGALTPTGAVATSRVLLLAMAGTLAMAGAVVRQTSVGLAGALMPTASLVRQTSSRLAGGLALVGTGARAGLLAVGGLLTPAASRGKMVQAGRGGTLTPSGTLAQARVVLLALAGALGLAGTLTRVVESTAVAGGALWLLLARRRQRR